MACCPAHDDRTPSLGVTLGRKAILFHCFAGCDQQSVLAALAREGIDAPALFAGRSEPIAPPATSVRRSSAAALKIWREATPLPGSPAKTYLEGRGILAASTALRFHSRTPLGPKGQTRFMPALIAAVTLATVGGVIAAGVFAGFITGKSGEIPQGRELTATLESNLPVSLPKGASIAQPPVEAVAAQPFGAIPASSAQAAEDQR